MPKQRPTLLILDGNALIHRSFHALPETMKTSRGETVNALYGFTAFLLRALKEFKPQMVVLALDHKGKHFRHEAYKEYKATRKAAPDSLYEQIPKAKEIGEALGIPVFQIPGCEADDVIGTVAEKLGDSVNTIIVTGDMDTLQLVNDTTKIYTMSRGLNESLIYDKAQIMERYGLTPEQIIDYKALRGDPSDNIPGVRGIGEKTAIELLKEFKTLDNLYKKLPKNQTIKPRLKELLLGEEKEARLSRELATIRRDIELEFKQSDLLFGDFDRQAAVKLFEHLEFRSLLPRLLDLTGKKEDKEARVADKFSRNEEEFSYQVITEEKDFKIFLEKLSSIKRLAFDTETSGFDCFSSDLLGISFSFKAGEAYFLSLRQPSFNKNKKSRQVNLFSAKEESNGNDSVTHPWLKKLKPILEDEKIKKVAHNGKFDLKILKQFGIEVAGFDFDTMLAAYLLNPGDRQYSLDALAARRFGLEKISSQDLLGQGKNKLEFSEITIDKLGNYACEDADVTWRLYEVLKKELDQKTELKKVFVEMEMPLIDCLMEMEINGLALDKEFLAKLKKVVEQDIKKLEKKIWQLAGREFNIASPKQMKEILFDELKISSAGLGKTKTGISTGAEELLKLKGQHPIIEPILAYRELTKLESTYISTLPLLLNPVTNRLHTSFNQTIAATGRLSSTEPNLQNIPIRTELGRRIRRAFIPTTGKKLLCLDYSQMELRLAAHLSEDKGLIKAFREKQDIHTATAATINHVEINQVTPEMRRQAKAINFGILYGQGPHGLAQTADIPYQEARQFIEEYFAAYSGIKKYIDKTIAEAVETGSVKTIFGRQRQLENITASNAMIRKAAERMAINTPIQGSAADIIKLAMIKIHKMIQEKWPNDLKMLLQVHDELIFEAKMEVITKVAPEIKKIMENVIKLSVPIVVEAKIGDNWEELEEFKI